MQGSGELIFLYLDADAFLKLDDFILFFDFFVVVVVVGFF